MIQKQCNWVMLLTVLAASASAFGQEVAGTSAADTPVKASEVEVIYQDGSRVRMKVSGETTIDIVTEYGQLTIPLAEIGRLRFQPRISESDKEMVSETIAQLGNGSFAKREKATLKLRTLGIKALPLLYKARNSSNAEIRQRVGGLLELLEEQIPEEQQDVAHHDLIETVALTASGQVVTAEFSGRSQVLGDVLVKIAQVHSLRSLDSPLQAKFDIDSAKYADPSNWLETPIEVGMLDDLRITASGTIDLDPVNDPGGDLSTPAGNNVDDTPGEVFAGTLVGRIGPHGKEFVIGEEYSSLQYTSGRLYLRIGPSPYDRCRGVYKIKANVTRAGK